MIRLGQINNRVLEYFNKFVADNLSLLLRVAYALQPRQEALGGLDRDERWLCPMPLTHVGGLMVLLRSAIYGTTALLAPPPFDPAK